ncbi:TPA: hypothetical protein ENS27_06565 [bacterium]|nr:hypothetical protein [bacterium]
MKKDNLVNTLFIGLGGTGIEVGAKLRALLVNEFASLKDILERVAFLFIDTDNSFSFKHTERNYMGENIDIKEFERLPIGLSNPDKENVINRDYFYESGVNKDEFLRHNFTQGAGAIRAYGRLALKYKALTIKNRIDNLLRPISDKVSDYNIIITTSFMGGTGSGIFLDVCYLTQSKAKKCLYALIGFPNMDNNKQANVVSSLVETEYLENTNFQKNDKELYEGFYIKRPKNVADYIFLVNHIRNRDGGASVSINDAGIIYELMAKDIYYTHMYKPTRDTFNSHRNNYKGKLRNSPKGLSQSFLTFGLVSEEIPTEKIIEAYSKKALSDYLKERIDSSDKVIYEKEKIFLGINAAIRIQPDFKKYISDINNELKKEEDKRESKDVIRKNVKNMLTDYLKNIEKNYGSKHESEPEYLKINKSVTNKIEVIYEQNYISDNDKGVNVFIKRGDFAKAYNSIAYFKKEIESEIDSKQNNKINIENAREKAFDILRDVYKTCMDEITISLSDFKWLIERLENTTTEYFERACEYIQNIYHLETLDIVLNKLKILLNQLEKRNISAKNISEQLSIDYTTIKGQLLTEYFIDLDSYYQKSKIDSDITSLCDFSKNTNQWLETITGEKVRTALLANINESLKIENYLMSKKEDLSKHLDTIGKEAEGMLELKGIYSEGEETNREITDTLKFLFVHNNFPLDDITLSEFNPIRNLEETDRILLITEYSAIPLNSIVTFSDYISNLETTKTGNDKIKGAFTSSKKEMFEVFEEIKHKIAPKTTIKPTLAAESIIFNEYQLRHLAFAMSIMNKSDEICDEYGLPLPIKDEHGLDLPAMKKNAIIQNKINDLLHSDKASLQQKVVTYLLEHKNDPEYDKIYFELKVNFLNRI